MSLSLNKVVLAGNLTRDPQVRFFANERAVADFGLAVNRKYKANDGTLKEETTFVDVEAWGRLTQAIHNRGGNLAADGVGAQHAGIDVKKFHGSHPWYKFVTETI